jgi:hypothetical protein
METVYYRVDIIWCKYPFNHVIDEKIVTFYQKHKKKFIMLTGLRIESNTSIKDKEEYLCKELNIKKVKVIKL